MDNTLAELQRRFHADPSNRQALNALARGLAATDKTVEAYNLLFDHGAVEREEPLALELGAALSALEAPLLSKRLGQASKFACKAKPLYNHRVWDYGDFAQTQQTKLPVFAIQTPKSPRVSKTLLKNLGNFSALRVLEFQGSELPNASLTSIPEMCALRHLALLYTNASHKSETIQRESFKHLCTVAKLTTMRLIACKMAPENFELCALQPNLKALHLGIKKTKASHLEFLSQLTGLKCLALHGPQFIEKKLPPLAESLETLSLYELLHGADCFQSLSLPKLQHLSLKNSHIRDKHLEWISEFGNLRTLELEGNPGISDVGLKQLTKMPKLEGLSLRYCVGITEEALKTLVKIPSLRVLLLPPKFDSLVAQKILQRKPALEVSNGHFVEDSFRLKDSLWHQCLGRPS
ncbi:MAG: hypothetical protein P1V97_05225 [Planctomycetota bacterium]|nr:hypothetical protein [Planctomycetota bacterium]